MTLQINGYMVVRLPHCNKDYLGGRGSYSAQVPRLDHIHYGGVERMPWFDIDEDLYAGTLPQEIRELWQKIEKANIDLPNIILTKELNVASTLLDYSNKSEVRNELISVFSEELLHSKGVKIVNTSSILWLGYDVIALPEWSLLRAGIFQSESSFAPWKKYLNENGLFTSLSFLDEYVQAYYEASIKGEVEEVWRLDNIARVQVGRVTIGN